MTTARRRLDPRQRRAQLLEIGTRLFGERPYEDVWIEEVAELAGVSRGLMYHYFPSKRDFFTAVVALEHEQLLALTEVDPALPVHAQIRAGLMAFIDYFHAHEHSFLVVNRGVLAADPEIRQLLDREQGVLRQRVLDSLGLRGRDRERAATAVWGWLMFTRAVCLDSISGARLERDELVELCLRTLVGALGPDVRLDVLPGPGAAEAAV